MFNKKIILVLSLCCILAPMLIASPGRSLTNSEMRKLKGLDAFSGCCVESTKTECNQHDECDTCKQEVSSSRGVTSDELDDPADCPTDGKNYAEVDYTKCSVAAEQNHKECSDNSSTSCYTEKYCETGSVQLDKCCKNHDCVSMSDSNCDLQGVKAAKCRPCSDGSNTGNDKDVTPQVCS